MRTRISIFLFLSVLAVCLLTSCGSSKGVTYFENREALEQAVKGYLVDARIMPKDVLTITVSTTTPEAARQFNLVTPTSQTQLQTYLVDNEGKINFPVVGELKVGGLTKTETEKLITERITPYLTESQNPVVTVRMSSFSISVLGEVNQPGTFTVAREKINVLEALSRAGDMTIYGVRNNVTLIREDSEGVKSYHTLNLNDANIVNSPFYYLQQNDIIYVEPNKIRAQSSAIGTSTSLWLSATGILMSVATLLVSIFK
jgi:polysaccharide export outer membrane protein